MSNTILTTNIVKEFFTFSTIDPSKWCISQQCIVKKQRTSETIDYPKNYMRFQKIWEMKLKLKRSKLNTFIKDLVESRMKFSFYTCQTMGVCPSNLFF